MNASTMRLFPRIGCRLPIQYRTSDASGYEDAVLCNFSKTGMYFEPEAIVMPEENLHILMSKFCPTAGEPECYHYYLAQAVWCRSIPDDVTPRYACGARLLKRGRLPDGVNAEAIYYTCDMCGSPTHCQDLRRTEDFLYLCSSCERLIAAVPKGHLKRSINRFLLGNVV